MSCHVTVHLTAVNWLDVHPAKIGLVHPWKCGNNQFVIGKPDTFVPVTDIVCRCAHITKKVRFNRTLKEEKTAIVPLSCFCGSL